ncbi:unnamed protein product [Cuscuta europaea]|uniref:Uncharacterized protein n=1 Tax=Cuscuta europaea TaxID=41803 RepID=A0A9P1ELV7_CUSEU|nr:unnamed protein product [Cuscuta europaea]
MALSQTVIILDQIPVSPPPEAFAGIPLPLTFFDVEWLPRPPMNKLIFYLHPMGRVDFLDSLIPCMKNSLSQSLQHYSPLAGRLVVSPDKTNIPEIRYTEGDTIPLVIAEFNSTNPNDFNHFVSNDARSSMNFNPLIPRLLPTSRASDGSLAVPLLALQITLFPDVGICIGVTNHHAMCDGSSIFGFMRAWAFFSNRPKDDKDAPPQFVPDYDRTSFKDHKELTTIYWDRVKNVNYEETHNAHRLPPIIDKVRSTFIMTQDDIQQLKNHVLARGHDSLHVSTFTVACSYTWSCLARSRSQTYKEDEDGGDLEEMENFLFPAECRARLDPPLPKNYFGNCMVPCLYSIREKDLVGDEGMRKAAEGIGGSIRTVLYNNEKEGVLKGARDRPTVISKLNFGRTLTVAGSPKFDYYGLDFGWGRAKKCEFPSIDLNGAISLGAAKDHEGGVEVGVTLTVTQMDYFTKIFYDGLKNKGRFYYDGSNQ